MRYCKLIFYRNVTDIVLFIFPLVICKLTISFVFLLYIYSLNSFIVFISFPSIDVIISPSFISVFDAGPFLLICAIYIPLLKFVVFKLLPKVLFKLLFKYGITSLSYAYIPSVACSNVPVLIKLSIIGFTTFIGTANPIPSADVIFTVFIPYYFSIWIY